MKREPKNHFLVYENINVTSKEILLSEKRFIIKGVLRNIKLFSQKLESIN